MSRHQTPGRRRTPLLPPHVTDVDHTDVDLVRRFVTERGTIRARRVTGLTPQQQRAAARAVENAREMALLPYVPARGSGRR
jgi:small subunit ribosomal protein S18